MKDLLVAGLAHILTGNERNRSIPKPIVLKSS
jgi:hypothetical protein